MIKILFQETLGGFLAAFVNISLIRGEPGLIFACNIFKCEVFEDLSGGCGSHSEFEIILERVLFFAVQSPASVFEVQVSPLLPYL